MLKKALPHLSYSNVMATVAVFMAMGGGAYALSIPKNSVGAKQLKRNAVHTSKVKKGAVTSSKVKDASLLAKDFKPGQLSAGAQGPAGNTGQPGPAGRSALTTLRSGETVRGEVGVRDNTGTSTGSLVAMVSLPIPAPVALDNEHVVVAGDEASTPCTGSRSNPTAPPGFACIYRRLNNNSNNTNIRGLQTDQEASPYGFRVAVDPANANAQVAFEGSWAYTAP